MNPDDACPECKGGPIIAGHAEIPWQFPAGWRYAGVVPCLRCEGCGEEFVEHDDLVAFEEAALAARKKGR